MLTFSNGVKLYMTGGTSTTKQMAEMADMEIDYAFYEVANNLKQRTELNYLVYNDPMSYAEMILNGEIEDYLKRVTR